MKQRYLLLGLILAIALITGYHYYAASQAEEQIVRLIEEQTGQDPSISVKHSSVEVTPFTGKVILHDVTIILGNHIERTEQLTVDLSYLDVLKFYLGGTAYALEHLYQAEAQLLRPSYVNKSNLQQVSADSLHLYFDGEALSGIRAAVSDTLFTKPQAIRAEGFGFRLQFPKTLVAGLRSQEFQYEGSVPAGKKSFWEHGSHTVTMDSLRWKPLEAFQSKYGFFIKGFGYATDAIPFHSARIKSSPHPQNGHLQLESELNSELALISARADIGLQQPYGASTLENATISISDFSPSFRRVLENIEQLLSISLPRNGEGILIRLEGTLAEPAIAN
ncbi:hypothetical protein [Fodinibius sediminis]|uniref:AsmA-like C-terminal region n=1 Tax=Fodinibius sediminis TaxID=1214077 RepID=A0A521D4Z6_9BACT|nr:hypothetical protein [Fodinibius sediminis]SMO66758.1 hypothetical protein SAMN06265218_108153 [Fodinibius sediminis]